MCSIREDDFDIVIKCWIGKLSASTSIWSEFCNSFWFGDLCMLSILIIERNVFFSVMRATLELQISVCLSIIHHQNPSAYLLISQISTSFGSLRSLRFKTALQDFFVSFVTLKLFCLFQEWLCILWRLCNKVVILSISSCMWLHPGSSCLTPSCYSIMEMETDFCLKMKHMQRISRARIYVDSVQILE